MTHTSQVLSRNFRTSRAAGVVLLCLCLLGGSAAIQAQQLTPAQIAYVKAETRKADEAYIKEVAGIVNLRTSAVAKVMPERSRIADPVARLIAGLEQSIGKALSDDQKAAIQEADLQRQKQIEWANVAARKR